MMRGPRALGISALGAVGVLTVWSGGAWADTLVVSNRGDGTIRVWDTATRAQITEIQPDLGAHEFGVSSDGKTIVGSCYGSGPRHQTPDHRVFVLDVATLGAPRVIDLGDNDRPNDVRFTPGSDFMVVSSEVKQRALEVDPATGKIVREFPYAHTAGHMLAVSGDGSRIYVACVRPGGVVAIDRATGDVLATIETPLGAEGIDIAPDGKTVWAACNRSNKIVVIDTATNTISKTIDTDGFPFRVRFTPDGKSVVIAHPDADDIRVYDAATMTERGRVQTGKGYLPTSVAISPDGARAYVVCGPVQKVAEIDIAKIAITHWYDTGPDPDGVAVTAVKPE